MLKTAQVALLVGLIVGAVPSMVGAFDYRALHLLEDRNTHAIIRVSEPPEGGDPPERGRADCSSLSVLSRRGRNVAMAFGRTFQRSGIHIDTILTSRVCRNIEAARLLQIGSVTRTDLLDPAPDAAAAQRQADDVLGLLDGLRSSETALLITHPDIIEALTGETLAPGEGLIFRLPPLGEPEVSGRLDLPPL